MKQKLLSVFLLCAFLVGVAYGQSKIVTGRVSDERGTPLAGVTVLAQGKSSAVQTDNYGRFSIDAEKGKTISFRIIGFSEKTVTIGDGPVYNVKLDPSDIGLEEVIVTAYGKQNKEAITGSVVGVSAKDIEKRPVTSAVAALEGMAPGLQINNSYGEPGSNPNVRIRGFGSINGNSSPTYVVDGVVFNGSISDLNPNDVESISVLKDATSGALYGNRAANGVIVITTKRGNKGTSEVGVTINRGVFARGIPEYDKLDPFQYMEATWQGYRNQFKTANPTWSTERANEAATKGLIPSILKTNIFNKPDDQLFDANGKLDPTLAIKGDYASDLDWFKPITRNGLRQEYALNGRGGSEKGSYYFNTAFLDEKGYIVSSDFKRVSARVNADITPKSWLKTGISVNASHVNGNNTTGSGSGFANPWMYARSIAPIYPIHLHDPVTGNYALDATGKMQYDDGTLSRNQYVGRHVIWETELNKNISKRNLVGTQIFADVSFLKNFKLSILGDMNLTFTEDRGYDNAIIGDGSGNNGRGRRTIYNYKTYTVQELLTYSNSFYGKHNLDVLLGHEHYGYDYTYLNGSKSQESFPGKIDLINFTAITSFTDYEVNRRSESFFSRLRYNYAEKYFVEGSLRRDGTSQLSPQNRWGTFWSLGGTWMASKEEFLKDISWMNSLKLRAATGVVGNLASLGPYDYMALYGITQNDNKAAVVKSNLENVNLRWEGNRSSSVALEGRLFNRLNFTAEYFDRVSDNLIFNLYLPLSTGSTTNLRGESTIKTNIGDLSNRGFEFSFDVDIIKNKDFTWNFGANATFLKNKINNLPDQLKENGVISAPFKYLEGHSTLDYFLFKYAGVDMLTGQSLYYANTKDYSPTAATGAWLPFLEEINGEWYTRNASYAVRDFAGTAIPKVMGGINSTFNYKSFSLSGLFTYSIGGKGLDYSYIDLMSVGATPSSIHKDVLKSWTEAPFGMTATSPDRINRDATPQINYTNSQYNNSSTSDRFLRNNSYFVIKNVAVGYRVPKHLVEKVHLNRVGLTFVVENLAHFTGLKGYSPQQTFGGYSQDQFVPARTFSFGVNVGF